MSADDGERTNLSPPPVDRVSLLWRRIHEHKIVQWTVAYVALAYAIQHGVILTSESLEWPNAVARVTMLLLGLGLPLTMILAWYHGDHASRQVSKAEFSIISLLLLIGSLWFYTFVQPREQEAAGSTPAVQQASVTAARNAAADPHGAISLAVVPFTNLSSDSEQEFFSDGIADEIGTALAKIPDLRVVARQSAYRFKGGKEDARAIGQALSATHLLEGSVRKAGNRVRISAELVKADDGLRIWAENYDRDLTDVFAIQEDIAHAIAASLRMPLGLKPGEQLVNERTANPASHESYLRAKALVRARDQKSIVEAIEILNGVVAREPNYASAWGLLGLGLHFQLLTHPAVFSGAIEEARPIVQANLAKAQAAAEQAVKLDPKNVDGYVALGELRLDASDKLSALDFFQRALAQDPDNPDALNGYSGLLEDAGFVKQALPVREHLTAVEPFVPVFQSVTARLLFASGQTDAALAIVEKQRPIPLRAEIYAMQGRYREAAEMLTDFGNSNSLDPKLANQLAAAVRLLRDAPKAAPPNQRPELGALDWVYLYAGAPERYLNVYEASIRMGFQPGFLRGPEWAPAYSSIRKTERFKAYVRDAGMLAYWRAKGWPEQCHPTTRDDFACA